MKEISKTLLIQTILFFVIFLLGLCFIKDYTGTAFDMGIAMGWAFILTLITKEK